MLQRAKWALGEDELKRLEERAKYFKLDKAKDFDSYKRIYLSKDDNDTHNLAKMLKNGDLNLMKNDYKSYYEFSLLPKIDNHEDVIIHTNSDATMFAYDTNNNQTTMITAKELSDIIKTQGGIKSGNCIRLLSCSSGKGENSLAQQLANELGVPVLAPTQDIYADNGYYFISDNDYLAEMWAVDKENVKSTGYLKYFYPDK